MTNVQGAFDDMIAELKATISDSLSSANRNRELDGGKEVRSNLSSALGTPKIPVEPPL